MALDGQRSTESLRRRILAGVPALEPTAQRVVVELVRLLAAGKPVPVGRVATTLGLPFDVVDAIVGGLRTVSRDTDGCVTSCFGLTVEQTEHRVSIGRRTVYAWCAWDVLLFPPLLGESVRCTSSCPVTGATVEVEVEAAGPAKARPSSTVLSFVLIDWAAGPAVREAFCDVVKFLSSPAAAERWTAKHRAAFALRLEDALALARAVDHACFPAAL